MGSKRGRLLMRQNRIKKESEVVDVAASPDPPEPGGAHHHLLLGPSRGVVERQSSEPTSSYLSVPVTSHLVKQNSSPHLSYTSSSSSAPSPSSSATPNIASTSTQVPTVHVQAPSPTESAPTPTITKSKSEEFRRTLSTVGCTVTEACEGSRFCHCPVLRPGPALGCNFCWNTIDTHGRILRRKTKYHCPECQTNLCIVPCFQEFHERQGTCRREPTVVQSTSGSSPPPPGGGSSTHQEWTSIVKTSSAL